MSAESRLIQTTHEMPSPMQPEREVIRRIEDAVKAFQADGGRVVSVKRHRNPVFDGPGEKTSTTFVVEWSQP